MRVSRIPTGRGGGEESAERGEEDLDTGRWIRSRNKLIPMISLDRIRRIQCAGNLRKNLADPRGGGGSASRQTRRFLPAPLLFIPPSRETVSFCSGNCALIRVAVANVTASLPSVLMRPTSAFSRPRDLAEIQVSINRAHVRVNPSCECNRYRPLLRIMRYDRWRTCASRVEYGTPVTHSIGEMSSR